MQGLQACKPPGASPTKSYEVCILGFILHEQVKTWPLMEDAVVRLMAHATRLATILSDERMRPAAAPLSGGPWHSGFCRAPHSALRLHSCQHCSACAASNRRNACGAVMPGGTLLTTLTLRARRYRHHPHHSADGAGLDAGGHRAAGCCTGQSPARYLCQGRSRSK